MKRILVLSILVLAVAVQASWADVPQTLSFQGVLKDNSGQVVADGTYSLTFNIYAVSGGGSLWNETQNATTSNGVYSVILGSSSPLTLTFDQPYELGLSVNGGSELTPRIALTAAPYSLNLRGLTRFNGSHHFTGNKHLVVDNDYGFWALNSAGNQLAAGVDTEPDGRLSFWAQNTQNPIVQVNGTGMNVSGSVSLTGLQLSTNAVNGWVLTSDASGNATWQPAGAGSSPWSVSGNNVYYNAGDVGIGTSTPGAKLDVTGAAHTQVLRITDGNGAIFQDNWIGMADNLEGSTKWLHIGGITDASARRLALFADKTFVSGNLGIGTTTPGARLSLGANLNSRLLALWDAPSDWYGLGINGSMLRFQVGNPGARFGFYAGDNTEIATFQGNGNVGVGTSSPAGFHVVLPEGNKTANPAPGITLAGGVSGNASIEIRNNNHGTPYLDFANDNSIDYDMRLILTSDDVLLVDGGTLQFTSSRRWKTNIHTLKDALEKVRRLRGVTYDWKEDGRHEIGLIAEEVGEVIPEVVSYEANGIDARGVDYARLVPVMIEAVKDQQKQIESQQATIEKQTRLIEKQQAALNALLQRVATLEQDNTTVRQTSATSTEE